MKGFRNWSALALVILCAAAASAAAQSQMSDSPHVVTARGNIFLLDGRPSFLIVGESRVCPDMLDVTDPAGTATIAQSLAALKVKVVRGLAQACGNSQEASSRLHNALGPLRMLWQETSKGVGPQPDGLEELVDWQSPLNSLNYPVDLPCDTYRSMGLYNRLVALARKGPVLAWVPIGSSPQDGQYVCLTPQKIRNQTMTAVIGGAAGIEWMTIDPRNSTIANGFSVSRGNDGQPDNFSAAKSMAQMLAQHSPMLTQGKKLKATTPDKSPVRAAAWSYRKVVTVIVVNTSDKAAKTVVTVPALGKKHAKIKVSLKKMADVTIRKRVK